jgi:hypothetical protein
MKFTYKQIALLGALFNNDITNYPQFEKYALAIFKLVELGDPYDTELAIKFVTQLEAPKGSLTDEKALKYFVEKTIYWADVV